MLSYQCLGHFAQCCDYCAISLFFFLL
jgi:hypothetical protein